MKGTNKKRKAAAAEEETGTRSAADVLKSAKKLKFAESAIVADQRAAAPTEELSVEVEESAKQSPKKAKKKRKGRNQFVETDT